MGNSHEILQVLREFKEEVVEGGRACIAFTKLWGLKCNYRVWSISFVLSTNS